MRVGTKSVLFGAHCFFLHPWFVAWAWWKLFGFPWDLRLWCAFAVHDIGYIGSPDMDGEKGEKHPLIGAAIMRFLFGPRWWEFTAMHSRFLAKKYGCRPSRLCIADKLAICLTPWWLYLPMVNWTGEIKEYMAMSVQNGNTKYAFMSIDHRSQREWYLNMQRYLTEWVREHKDGREDSWTPAQREAADTSGVWR